MPKRASVHIDAPLTNLAIQFRNLPFIAELVFPIVPVVKESDKFYVFAREELRRQQTRRAIGSKSNEFHWDVSTDNYSCEEDALSSLLPDRIVNNSDAPIRPRTTTMQKLMKAILLSYEIRVKDLVTGGSLTSANPAFQWDDGVNTPTIEADIDTGKASIRLNAGAEPNSLFMNDQVKDVVKKDSTVRNLLRYTVTQNAGKELVVNGDLPPVLWNLKVAIAGAAEDTANEGQASSIERIWPDDVLIAFIEPAPSLQALTLGYTFRVTNGITVKVWRDEPRDGEMIEPRVIQDEKIVATQAGYLIDNVLG